MIGSILKGLLALSGKWRAGMVIIVVGGMIVAIAAYRAQATQAKAEVLRLNGELAAAKATIASRENAISAMEAQRAREIQSLETTLKNDKQQACKVQALRERTYHAKPSEDGPVAPVLRSALDGLRSPAGSRK